MANIPLLLPPFIYLWSRVPIFVGVKDERRHQKLCSTAETAVCRIVGIPVWMTLFKICHRLVLLLSRSQSGTQTPGLNNIHTSTAYGEGGGYFALMYLTALDDTN